MAILTGAKPVAKDAKVAAVHSTEIRSSRWVSLVFLSGCFIALQEFSVAVAGQGVTANYSYLFLPLLLWLVGNGRRLVHRRVVERCILIFCLVYFAGLPSDLLALPDLQMPARRLASFAVFLFPLLLSFVEFTRHDLRVFKTAVVLASAYYAAGLVRALAASGGVGLFELNSRFGSQRYGFILCLGFFLTVFDDNVLPKRGRFWIRLVTAGLLASGIVLTFSRSSVVALASGLLVAGAAAARRRRRRFNGARITRPRRSALISIVVTVAVIVGAGAALQDVYGTDAWAFYRARLVDPFVSGRLGQNFASAGDQPPGGVTGLTSEGVRGYLWLRSGEYLVEHPLLGSNFRGLYLLYDEFRDGMSTHNQYIDVFLRTGLVGGIVWLVLLYRIVRFCNQDRGLQAGIAAVIVYGFFHETFKESNGSFIFGMLLSFSYLPRLGEHGRPAGAPVRSLRKSADVRRLPSPVTPAHESSCRNMEFR